MLASEAGATAFSDKVPQEISFQIRLGIDRRTGPDDSGPRLMWSELKTRLRLALAQALVFGLNCCVGQPEVAFHQLSGT